jgi:Four helical bundle domain/ABC transporter
MRNTNQSHVMAHFRILVGHSVISFHFATPRTRKSRIWQSSHITKQHCITNVLKMANLEPPSDILRILRGSLEETSIEDAPGGEEVIGYCAFLAAGLADTNNFEPTVWEEALAPYLSSLVQTGSDRIIESFRNATEAAIVGVDDAESYGDGEDDGAEELCNIRFNLAYGGKILLHQTKLRLLRGHRYGLVGQNGAGKTTLMTAIEKGKLDGWPNHLMTHYCDSGSNVDPVYEARIVLADLMETTKRSKERCIEMMETLKFTDTMMHR